MTEKPNKIVGSAIKVFPGISIYRVNNSRFWYVRVWDRNKRRYAVKGTGETTELGAKRVAQDVAVSLLKEAKTPSREFSFKIFAQKMVKQEQTRKDQGQRSLGSFKVLRWCVDHEEWGLIKYFGAKDVRTITTADYLDYLNYLQKTNPEWSPSTLNIVQVAFRNVMKVARQDRVIDTIPDTPRSKQKDNPRPFFRFHPLVEKQDDAYQKILRTAEDLADMMRYVRGILITEELRDLILFVTHSFVRPIASELYALKHQDIVVADNPRRLILTIRDGKTGYRASNTLEAAVSVYERILKRYPDAKPSDFIFLPHYLNRTTAGKVIQRQFRELLAEAKLQTDTHTGQRHSIYSLRHTAICMRLINSGGQVNIFNLAKNAGTSVEQIERFYARNLPLSAELARNLQSFAKDDEKDGNVRIEVESGKEKWKLIHTVPNQYKSISDAMKNAAKDHSDKRIRAITTNRVLLDIVKPSKVEDKQN